MRDEYVVIEFNQASGQPRVVDDTVASTLEEAEDIRDAEQERTWQYGRRERYRIARIDYVDEEE